MSEHTPGPWGLIHDYNESIHEYEMFVVDAHGVLVTSHPVEDAANARLIAASPRLYEYVKRAADTDATALDLLRELGLE